jgi:anti-sigma regulatory factor (Ser/Thr protein kinase)
MARAMDLAATFPPDTSSPAGARRFVGGALATQCEAEQRDVVALLTSELAANAVLHARTDFEVRIHLGDDLITVEVVDDNPRTPVPADVPPDASSGRGLKLVQALAEKWGVEPVHGGKTIWFQVPTGSS